MHYNLSDSWDMLCTRYQKKTLPHAILLVGPKGAGKGDFARRFAEYILCSGNSKNALQTDFFDLKIADTIKIDHIRELIAFANTTPQIGQHKVILIEAVERMNTASANALLKTLEEPPGQMLILLTTHQLDNLLPTIRSRCQIIKFPEKISTQYSLEMLAQRQEQVVDFRDILIGQGDIVKTSECWAKLDQIVLLDNLTNWIIDLIRLKNGFSSDLIDSRDVADILMEIQCKLDIKKLFIYLDRLYEARRCLFNRLNPNTQLVLETLFI